MDSVDLDDATNELYALTPAEFTARRTALVAQARDAKQADVAKAVSELRRPTVSAWLLNQLARGEQGAQDEVDELESLGTDLREAQAQLDGRRMKELTRRRHELVAALVRRAEAVAQAAGDQKVSASVQRELEETLGAAVADEQASLAVTSGRLTRALVYAGLGEVDVTAATATPISNARRPKPATKSATAHEAADDGQDAADRARRAADAERRRAVEAAEAAAAEFATAEDELVASERRRDQARAQEAELAGRLDELQREILQARHELDAVSRKVAAADRDHQRQERQTRDARKAAQRAEQALARLEPQGADDH
jgi:chromosome segregation ATPase